MGSSVEIARAQRDRKRITELNNTIRALKNTWSWRMTAPLRAGASRLRRKFATPAAPRPAASPTSPDFKPLRALLIDSHWPQPDRDSGSMDIVTLIRSLSALGYEVTFAADLDHVGQFPARDALAARGVRCLGADDAPSVTAFIEGGTDTFDLAVLCRVYCGGNYLEPLRANHLVSRIVFNTVDLHFLRMQRQAALDDGAGLEEARTVQAREEALIAASDATIVVSSVERELLLATMPDSFVVELPLARQLNPPVASFAERRGIGFIGGFAHAPNADGLRWFVREIWPLVLRDDPDCELQIAGADLPDDLLVGVTGRVRALGHVPDIGPWFEQLRLTVAPLRFGAGAKGKVASSLAAGVPCIATTIAAEGMALRSGEHVLVADTPTAFAAALRRAYDDQAVWTELSRGGLAFAAERLSSTRWQAQLGVMLREIGL